MMDNMTGAVRGGLWSGGSEVVVIVDLLDGGPGFNISTGRV
jgi:hypothetical protein